MTYKILSTRQQDTILFTLVEFNFDNKIMEIEIAHFNPESADQIEQNIHNRAISEIKKLEISNSVSSLMSNIEIEVIKNINI
jgi:hypothetical protein